MLGRDIFNRAIFFWWWMICSQLYSNTFFPLLYILISYFPEGVQLLCLIDKAADACRYLQTYGEWNRAAWLAKVCSFSAFAVLTWMTYIGMKHSDSIKISKVKNLKDQFENNICSFHVLSFKKPMFSASTHRSFSLLTAEVCPTHPKDKIGPKK